MKFNRNHPASQGSNALALAGLVSGCAIQSN